MGVACKKPENVINLNRWAMKRNYSALHRLARRAQRDGFTFPELLLVAAILALLAILALPAFANNKTRSQRLVCVNNLRQIGIAMQLWGGSREDQAPWRTTVAEGGTSDHPLAENAWLHFSWISNELASPKVLACPSDASSRSASEWKFGSTGFLNPFYRANALSYFVCLHSDFEHPLSWLSGDRNLQGLLYNQACGLSLAVGTSAVSAQTIPSPPNVQWTTTEIHAGEGNLLLNGGQVLQVNNTGLAKSLIDSIWFSSG